MLYRRFTAASFLLLAKFGMARRRRNTSSPGLALVEGAAVFVGLLMLLVFVNNPKAGRELFQVVPLLVIGVAVLAVIFVSFRCSLKFTSADSGIGTATFPDNLPRGRNTAGAPPSFPRIDPEPKQERILTMEEKLDRLDWFQFEKVIAMLYSARGCKVERRGGANPDGGIDLIVQSGTEPFAVQCKFWKAYEVGVRQVREFLGALQDARVSGGVIVSIKGFTNPARELAARHHIELICKSNLLGMLKDARYTPHIREINALMDSDDKHCPKCERHMVLRTSSKDRNKFWGCSGFPRCHFTLQYQTDLN